jgi:hypothetical protein
MSLHTLRGRVCGSLFLLFLAQGCSSPPSRPHVRGKITFQGKPVAGRTLALYSEGKPGEFFSQKMPLGPDGSFSGEMPAPGKYKIVIEESLAVQEGRKPANDNRPKIPRKYRAPATSDLFWTIHDGDNDLDFDLKE